MFWVCKTFSQIRGTQRTLNQTRTTSKTFYFEKSVNPPFSPQFGPRFFIWVYNFWLTLAVQLGDLFEQLQPFFDLCFSAV